MVERRTEVETRVPSKLWSVARQCKKCSHHWDANVPQSKPHTQALLLRFVTYKALEKDLSPKMQDKLQSEKPGFWGYAEQSQEKLLLKSLVEVVSYGAGEGNHRWLVRRREGQGAHSRLCNKESADILTSHWGRLGWWGKLMHAVRAHQQAEKATFASEYHEEDLLLSTKYGEWKELKWSPWWQVDTTTVKQIRVHY